MEQDQPTDLSKYVLREPVAGLVRKLYTFTFAGEPSPEARRTFLLAALTVEEAITFVELLPSIPQTEIDDMMVKARMLIDRGSEALPDEPVDGQ